jgi:uncharacterized repeat protein (TIGR03803 family)
MMYNIRSIPRRSFAKSIITTPWTILAVALVALTVQPANAEGFKILYTFTGGPDGGQPETGVILRDGKLYGTTLYGGASGIFPGCCGTVFEIDLTTGQEITLHTFAGKPDDGAYPYGGLVADAEGNLYGTTGNGGQFNFGTIFKIDLAGNFTVIYSFTGTGPDGGGPQAGLAEDSEGDLYGTALGGSAQVGTLFAVGPSGNFSTLYTFTSAVGVNPDSPLLIRNGELYGTTQGGVKRNGTVFRVNAANGAARLLYRFTGGNDGGYPVGGLVGDDAGNLYGVTMQGGSKKRGVVYAIDPSTGSQNVLHSFTCGADGCIPAGRLVPGPQGTFYGTANQGGSYHNGTVFKIDTAGNLTTVHNFIGAGRGGSPIGALAIGPAGTLYGATQNGGSPSCLCGTVFALVP